MIKIMTSEQGEKIKDIIENSKSFALVTKEEADEYDLLAREAVKIFLKNKGKLVYLISQNPDGFKNKWSDILTGNEDPLPSESILIRIPKGKAIIKEINYEDAGETFDLNIAIENGGLNPEEIVLESKSSSIDAVFSFGISKHSDTESILQSKDRINAPAREKMFLFNPDEELLAKKILDLTQPAQGEPINDSLTTVLFALMIVERMCALRQSKEKTAELEKDLIRLGADKNAVKNIITESLSLDNLPII